MSLVPNQASGADAGSAESRALLRRLIAEKGLTQAEFAAAAGISKDHLSRVLRGAAPFPRGRRTLLRLARALECAPDRFIEFREENDQASDSVRLVLERLAANRIDLAEFLARVPQYSPGYLRAILAGRCPFPTDPDALEAIGAACGALPQEFREFLPDAASRDRWLAVAEKTLDAQDFGVFRYLLDKIAMKGRQGL